MTSSKGNLGKFIIIITILYYLSVIADTGDIMFVMGGIGAILWYLDQD
ncbi:hypothetical protein LCGC14_1938210 [marine sediment metagenome]|uniref:Uncharacterized protein n=1 Tax=marine sediment metagenome TaxID=412755 RepID=A0A0F9G9J3_9ZZZZ